MDEQLAQQLLEWNRSKFFGKYRGLVTDNEDTTNRGRVKVQVPAVLNELEHWAMPCLPYAGNNVGLYTIPEPGAGVRAEGPHQCDLGGRRGHREPGGRADE